MSVHLVTGYAGKEHITSDDHGAFQHAVIADGSCVLNSGDNFAISVISNNEVRIYSGDLLMQGRHIRQKVDTYESINIENGAQGMLRNDLIVVTYTKDSVTGVEDAYFEILKGTPVSANPTDPSYTTGNILSGALKSQMPLYRIPLNGLTVGTPVRLFTVIDRMQDRIERSRILSKAEFSAAISQRGYVPDAKDVKNNLTQLNTNMVNGLAGKSSTSHTHDDRYYTESEIASMFAINSYTGTINTTNCLNGAISIRKYGRVAFAIFNLDIGSSKAVVGNQVATMPSQARPIIDTYAFPLTSVSNTGSDRDVWIKLQTAGGVYIQSVHNTTGNEWFQGSFAYITSA